MTFHSDLRRRAASRRALPRTSSCMMFYDHRNSGLSGSQLSQLGRVFPAVLLRRKSS